MKKEDFSKYELNKLYLREFQYNDGEYDITFNIVDIDVDKMTIKLARNHTGKISVIEYDLHRDNENNLYLTYGVDHTKIEVDDFEEIND